MRWITLNLLNRSRRSWSSGTPRTANTEIPSSGTPSSAQNSAVRAASWPRVAVVSGPPRMTSTSPPSGSSARRRVAISLRSRIDPLASESSRKAHSQLAEECNDLFCGKILRNCSSRFVLVAVLLAHPKGDTPETGMFYVLDQRRSRGTGSERPRSDPVQEGARVRARSAIPGQQGDASTARAKSQSMIRSGSRSSRLDMREARRPASAPSMNTLLKMCWVTS